MNAPHFKRLVIDGVGLMGGSLGMGARRRGLANCVVGLGRSEARLAVARERGAVDEIHTEPATALDGADALVMCTPTEHIVERMTQLAPHFAPGAFVTDVGSVKARIVAEAAVRLPDSVRFIGSHPMAGSDKTGVAHAEADFYEGRPCILTPTSSTPPETTERACAFWEALGSRVIVLPPERHDRLLAGVSHLPHLVSAALMQTLARHVGAPSELDEVAGGGLLDMTRIAGADPDLWQQIFSANAPHVAETLDDLIGTLEQWRAALRRDPPDADALRVFYGEACDARREMMNDDGG